MTFNYSDQSYKTYKIVHIGSVLIVKINTKTSKQEQI